MKNLLLKMTKAQLIELILKHEKTIERLDEENERLENDLIYLYNDDQMNERFDQGYDDGYYHGQRDSKRELSSNELSKYHNVLRFG